MAARRTETWLQASATGNGVGVSIVEHDDRHLVITVLPKLWRRGRSVSWRVDVRDEPVTHVAVFERDRVVLPPEWADALLDAEQVLGLPPGGLDGLGGLSGPGGLGGPDADEGEHEPLWTPVFPGRSSSLRPAGDLADVYVGQGAVAASRAPEHLWELIEVAGIEPPLPESFPFGALRHAYPRLRAVYMRTFLERVGAALPHRRPQYLARVEPLGVVRGRMVPRDLIVREATARLPVVCEYEELTTDTPLWQRVRAALLVCAGHSHTGIRDTAALHDARLTDVSVVPIPVARALDAGVLRREELRAIDTMARAILDDAIGFGSESAADRGIAVSVKVPTSRVWTRLIVQAVDGYGFTVPAEPLPLEVFEGQGHAHPDVQLDLPGRPAALLVDGIYSRISGEWASVSGSAQYQMHALATAAGCPAVIVYPVAPVRSPVAPRAASIVRGRLGTERRVLTGTVPLPFPMPGHPAIPVDRAALARMLRREFADAASSP
ncbi:hypothetical protein [Microbacterium sp. No. 7]|uniref:hypothetical protein n=1 Tax=Microbacterium sp. No. 7 TaxID=1714373 RepID=UPI0006CF6AC6|nr:hypothetical protein [Microbacterium sp. No. 7]ALJ21774.1 hypothetical protein AOA12_18495 [Microbacterium sp. No. 7]